VFSYDYLQTLTLLYTNIQTNLYLATFKEVVNKKFSIFSKKNNTRYDYDVYIVLNDKVVGVQQVLFVSCVKMRSDSRLYDYIGLTLNSVFIVSG
jgi:hypothetical protein